MIRTPLARRPFVLLLLAAAGPLSAQRVAQAPPRLTVARVFSREFAERGVGRMRWLDGGSAFTMVERSADGKGMEVVRHETATDARTVLLSVSQLTPPGATAPLDFDDYVWSADRKQVLLFTNTRKVWRQNTRGDYWVLDRTTNTLRKLGGDAPPASLMFAKFSPDGKRVAYVRANDLYAESLVDGSVTRLTRDGSRTSINGTSDWVYEEELEIRDAFAWSPDGSRIAFWHFDASPVRDFTLINDTDSLYPYVTRIPYPKAGTTNSRVTIGVVAPTGGPVRWMEVVGDSVASYIARMEWVDSVSVLVQHLNRKQNANELWVGDVRTGRGRVIHTERDSAWVDVDDLRWIEDGRTALFTSESGGWRHVYRIDRFGGGLARVTGGAYDVIGIAGVDERASTLYFYASPENATQRYLYRTAIAGGGQRAERVTPAGQLGTHRYDISPDGRWAIHTVSRFAAPPRTELIELPSHTTVRVLEDNAVLRKHLATVATQPVEFLRVSIAGGVSLDGYLMRPTHFDSTRKYPILVYVYGEPAGQTVVDQWQGSRGMFHRLIADEGYVVVSFDNRGTPAPKGRAWRKSIYGAVGVASAADQAAALRALGRQRRYLDTTRVAIWGWSGGGSNTLNAMFRNPDLYQVGMSVAPVPDQRLYDTIYQERYMGLPQENARGYHDGSPINFAAALRGKLLVVHGSGDDNVHYQGTERLVNRLIELGKSFDLMVYPNRTHGIFEGSGTTVHVYSLLHRYLTTNLPPGGRLQSR